ncbi:hypothetical protein F5887DRAFT_979168 [Amanita rubescens]|nr:hypothetical protein F5887DRAFT_979168 [Amanita rubescens]
MTLLPDGSSFTINVTSPGVWAQAYCLNPPNDSCIYDYICPNPDVTGMGQQISIYVTEIIFSMLLLYWPEKIRVTMYSHYALIFSLLISATISLSRQQLTQNDAIFVVLMVASPTSIYLWLVFLLSFRKPALFPTWKIGSSSKETFLLKLLCSLTLLYEIGMAIIVFGGVLGKFSQAACFHGYSKVAALKLLWPVLLAMQLLPVLVCPLPDLDGKLLWRKRPAVGFASWFHTWMPRALWPARYSRLRFSRAILAIIQVQVLIMWIPFPIFLSITALFLSCCLSTWHWEMVFKNFARGPRWRSYLAIAMMYGYPAANIAMGSISSADFFGPTIRLGIKRNTAWILFTLCPIPAFSLLLQMIILWLMTSPNSDDNVTIWSRLTSEMHLLKFGVLIVIPSVLWVSSIITANPTTSAWNTFGQIFAIGTTLGNILNICVELQELGGEKLMSIFWSVLRSEEIKAQNHADATQHSESSRLRMDTGSSNDITAVGTSISSIELSELGMGGPVRRLTW